MFWGTNHQLADLTQQLVETLLRAERLKLAQHLHVLEARAVTQGVVTSGFGDLRKTLKQVTLDAPDRVDRSLLLLRKPSGIWRRKYLAVQVKPGSVF